MTKEEQRQEAEEWLCNNLHSASEEDFIKAMVDIAEPREKQLQEKDKKIAELVSKNYKLEYQKENLENKIEHHQEVIDTLQKENAELRKKLLDVEECFISASSGDDFEMAESAREVMEVLDIPCYRHNDGREKSKLTKAKELLEDLIRFQPYIDKEAIFLPIGSEWKTAIYKAEQFLREGK